MRTACVMIGLALALPSAASARVAIINVSKSHYVETYFDRRNISNQSRLVGWQSGDLMRPIKQADVTVAGISPDDRTLCVEVEHVSGGYLGSARVKVDGKARILTLHLPATIFERRPHIVAGDLSVLVRASETSRCTSANPILMTSWGAQPPGDDTNLLLNQGLGVVTRVSVAGQVRPTPCQRLDQVQPSSNETRQQFNTVCRVRLPAACQAQPRFEIVTDPAAPGIPNLAGNIRRPCGP